MYTWLKEIKGSLAGQDVYIIGSGASMNFMPKSFFDDKTVIGINRAMKFFNCRYVVVKDIVTPRGMIQWLRMAKECNTTMITTSAHQGGTHLYNTKYDYFVFPEDGWNGFVRTPVIDTDVIVNSHSTVTSAIHVAYYLGAKNIILCGIDCGVLDGKSNIDNYYEKPRDINSQGKIMSHPYHELNITTMRDELKKRGCNVVSLNPFINIGLEGHKFEKLPIPENEMWAGEVKNIKL